MIVAIKEKLYEAVSRSIIEVANLLSMYKDVITIIVRDMHHIVLLL